MDDYQDHISANSRPDLGFDSIYALPENITPY